MSATDSPLIDLVAAVADGRTVDWTAVLATASSDAERLRIEELSVIARVASLHGSVVSSGFGLANEPLSALPCEWGPLLVQALVGRGSSGVVYRAWDARLHRAVALKLLPADAADVLREGRMLARVRHRNVITVFGAEQVGNQVGLWMEFIEGRTLAREVRDGGALPAATLTATARELTAAVVAVHSAGILHRDIKPHNVMRDTGGRVVLSDFGTGREQEEPAGGGLMGTPLYLAPEILGGAAASVASDVYSLGVTIFFLATGGYPVAGASLGELRAAHVAGGRRLLRRARPDLRGGFAEAVDRALEREPSRRFATAAAFQRALETRSFVRRSFRAAALMALAVGLGVVVQVSRRDSSTPAAATVPGVPPGRYAHAVTAPSAELRALYDAAHAQFFQGREGVIRAKRMLEDAVALAPEFASAHILLAWAIRNLGDAQDGVLPHADRAVLLAVGLPDTERLFITGSAHQLRGDYRAAMRDYERLLRLDPEHYWALGNLAMVYAATGDQPAFLADLYERRAKMHPADARTAESTARELTLLGELARARPYLRQAMNAPQPGARIGWLELADAYDAWFLDRPAEMQERLDRLVGRLPLMSGQERTNATHDLGNAYLDLGQINKATQLFRQLESVDEGRHQLFAFASAVRGDLPAVRAALQAHVAGGRKQTYPGTGPLFFDAGLVREGLDLLQMWRQERFWSDRVLRSFAAESSLFTGDRVAAMRQLREAIHENRAQVDFLTRKAGAPLLRASRVLARLETADGHTFAAVRVLEEASADRIRACVIPHSDGYQWLEIRAALSKLYREVGRLQEADDVAAQIRGLLSRADEGHPLKYFE